MGFGFGVGLGLTLELVPLEDCPFELELLELCVEELLLEGVLLGVDELPADC